MRKSGRSSMGSACRRGCCDPQTQASHHPRHRGLRGTGCHRRIRRWAQPKPSRRPRSPCSGLPLSPRLLGRPCRLRHPQAYRLGNKARTTIKPYPRPAAHHEWSGGGTKPIYFLAIKGEELSFAAGSIEVGVADDAAIRMPLCFIEPDPPSEKPLG